MLNGEAFISEIKANGSGEGPDNEFIEITIAKTANLSDYTLSFYHSFTGLLEPGYSSGNKGPGSSFFPNQGEITLADVANQTGSIAEPEGSVASTIDGLALEIVEHQSDSDYWVIVIPFSGAGNDSNSNSVGTVALTNTSTSVSEAYNINGGSTTALGNGAAAGTTQVATSGTDVLIDGYGTQTTGPSTPGESVLCFAADVDINVPGGTCTAGDLNVGDEVVCIDGDSRPIIWIGISKVSQSDLDKNPKLRPVRIAAGALGCGLPSHDLLVSRQHRVLVRSSIAERMFDTSEVLIPAIKLVGIDGISVDDTVTQITYVHILLDRHEVIFANGAFAESLFSGPEAQKVTGPEVWEELMALWPDIVLQTKGPKPARHIPDISRQRRLIERHKKNGKPLFRPEPRRASFSDPMPVTEAQPVC